MVTFLTKQLAAVIASQGTGWHFYPCPDANIFYLQLTDGCWYSVTEGLGLGSVELICESGIREQYKKEAEKS